MNQTETLSPIAAPSPFRLELSEKEGNRLILYSLFWSVMLLLAVPLGAVFGHELSTFWQDLARILFSPSKLVTDYFELGGLGASFFNAALCGLGCNFLMWITKAKPSATLLAGYFLVIAHCFYGLNIVNMWLPIFGFMVYCAVMKKPLKEVLHIAFFSTSLGPFISDFLFRYTLGDAFDAANPTFSWVGLGISILFSLMAGFIIPAILPGTSKMHRGHNLYKAGLAIGLFGIFAFALFYKTMGIAAPEVVHYDNEFYDAHGRSYRLFVDVFFGLVFGITLLLGFIANGKSFKGYGRVWDIDGLSDDLPCKFGIPLTLINIGFYGFCVIAYFNIITVLTPGADITGPTVGVTIAAITFSAAGQTPKNVWPIAAGYLLLFFLVLGLDRIFGLPMSFSISDQGYINGLAFATGLCPFVGRYNRKVGMVAGFLDAVLCTSTAAMHGGFVLYNGGLTAGLTALLLLPILDFYKVKQKENDPTGMR